MRREFLKNLGIEDKDIIDKIMDENSADIGRAKGELQTVKDTVTELENKITTLTDENKQLKSQNGEIETLRNENKQLKTDKENLSTELNTKVSQLQRDHAIEGDVRNAKAKNIKAVIALLDQSKITYEDGKLNGLTEQLDALQKGEDTSFLFTTDPTPPTGTNLHNPPAGSGGTPPTSNNLAEAVAKALGGNK